MVNSTSGFGVKISVMYGDKNMGVMELILLGFLMLLLYAHIQLSNLQKLNHVWV